MIVLGGKEYSQRDLDPVEEAFFLNFLRRRLVSTYGVPLQQTTDPLVQHALHDLNAVRYRTWLMLRGQGVTLTDLGRLVTDENAVDVFLAVWTKSPVVLACGGEEALAQVNARRAAVGKPPIGGTGEPVEESAKPATEETAGA